MPIVSVEKIKEYVLTGKVIGISIDTCIFETYKYGFEVGYLAKLNQFKGSGVKFIMPDVVNQEIISHVEAEVIKHKQEISKKIRELSNSWGISQEKKSDALNMLFGKHDEAEVAKNRFASFANSTGMEIVNSSDFVKVQDVLNCYFERSPPFSQKKKNEFPDAFSLLALEGWASQRNGLIIVVSNDGDWKSYCDNSDRLISVDKLDVALSSVNYDADDVLNLVKSKILADDIPNFKNDVFDSISSVGSEFDVSFIADSFLSFDEDLNELICMPHDISYQDLVDGMAVADFEDGRLVLSTSVSCSFFASYDISFSVWDSIDKETVSIGGNTYEGKFDRDVDLLVTFYLEDGEVSLGDIEVVSQRLMLNFGTIEPWDDMEEAE